MASTVFHVAFVVLVSLLAYNLFVSLSADRAGSFLTEVPNGTYDYIIVGAGSSGCVVASRLSEDPDVNVLLIEAGLDDRGDDVIATPGKSHFMLRSKYDWEFYTVPQKHGLRGFNQQRSYWPRGKALGGTSNLYSMVYIRGHRKDFDRWAAMGADGWSYKDVLPFFLKLEDMTDPELAKSKYHNTGGPMKVTKPNTMPLTDILLKSGLEIGLKMTDPNGEKMEGLVNSQANSYNGLRWSSSRGYLHPVMGRDNLHVMINSHVTKVLLEGKKAVGVEYIRQGRKHRVDASREIIISSGAIGSPQLLMLSGVGPKKQLEEHGIPVVADLPVGQNLQDHLFFDYQIGLNTTVSATVAVQESLATRIKHRLFGKGVLSSCHFVEVQVFDCTDDKSRKQDWPDLQIMFHQTPWTVEALKAFGYSEETLRESSHRNDHVDMFSCEASMLRPESIGTITLRSRDPFDYPLIDPNYLQSQEDVDMLVRGIRYCQRFETTPTLRQLGAINADSPNTFCRQHEYDTDAYWECMVRQKIHTIYHPSGTCRMGKTGDPKVVLDPQLRVQGVTGLRVVDASVMPRITSGNINTPCLMIGEKAAHMIKEARGKA